MPGSPEQARSTAELVDSMFGSLFDATERALLLQRIEGFDAANPGLDNARRITGWIDVAYAFQAERRDP